MSDDEPKTYAAACWDPEGRISSEEWSEAIVDVEPVPLVSAPSAPVCARRRARRKAKRKAQRAARRRNR